MSKSGGFDKAIDREVKELFESPIVIAIVSVVVICVFTVGAIASAMHTTPRALYDQARGLFGHAKTVAESKRPTYVPPEKRAAVAATLAHLRVAKAGDPDTYARDKFGPAWADIDHNGCDQRNDVLRRDLSSVRLREGSRCIVIAGHLTDPYTGAQVDFTKARASDVQIDHIVALKEAWVSGASAWTPQRRAQYANTLTDIQASKGSVNEQKGGDDVTGWRPSDPARQCLMARKVIAIKQMWGLSVDDTERAVLGGMLAKCAA